MDGRLLPVVLLLALTGVIEERLPRWLSRAMQIGAPVATGLVLVTLLVCSQRFQREAAGYREVLARVPAQATLLNLPLDPTSDVFVSRPFIHYDKLVLADRPIVVSDIWFHQGSAVYPKAAHPALRLPSSYSESDLRRIDWPAYRLEDWDFVLIRTRVTAPAPFVPPALALELHAAGWWLYRRSTDH